MEVADLFASPRCIAGQTRGWFGGTCCAGPAAGSDCQAAHRGSVASAGSWQATARGEMAYKNMSDGRDGIHCVVHPALNDVALAWKTGRGGGFGMIITDNKANAVGCHHLLRE